MTSKQNKSSNLMNLVTLDIQKKSAQKSGGTSMSSSGKDIAAEKISLKFDRT